MLTRCIARIEPPDNVFVMVIHIDIMFKVMADNLHHASLEDILPMCRNPIGLCYGAGILIAAPVVTFIAMLFLKIPLSLEGRSAAIPGILAGCMWQVCTSAKSRRLGPQQSVIASIFLLC